MRGKSKSDVVGSLKNPARVEIFDARFSFMKTYLLTWSPEKWPWSSFESDYKRFNRDGFLDYRWSCGNSKRIVAGDRVFLLRQGKTKRGIVASGEATSGFIVDEHYSDPDKSSLYISLRWSVLLDVFNERYPRENLDGELFARASKMNWNTQGSGISVHDDVAAILEVEWEKFLDKDRQATDFPEEIPPGRAYVEGATKTIRVNAYERSEKARRACIEFHKSNCAVCTLDFEARYGELGKGFIHVHHLKPLARIGAEYKVDPIRDLRPVCPNCHAMLHRKSPPFSIQELKRHLKNPD